MLLLALAACTPEAPVEACDADALSTCAAPAQDAAWYEDAGVAYFNTLDATSEPDSGPAYAELVARWEWPPWLKLTGYGAEMVEAVDKLVLVGIPGTTVPDRDCRAFTVAPFGRCKVVMDYEGKNCPIYEEFTFNAAGDITFIEAWSDLEGLRPMDAEADPWAESDSVERLSTRIPGLGSDSGEIDPAGEAMTAAGEADADVADFARRAQDFWPTWSEEYANAGDDLFERGCGWVE